MSDAAREHRMWTYFRRLRSWQLFVLALALFLIDLALPDPVPMLDEILLGVLTLFLANWRTRAR